ncbi:MAG: hypothetical protein J6P46_05920 [Bacteroidales bacterium]|nr:hypothetical protein [Bacteroidales bacterium]
MMHLDSEQKRVLKAAWPAFLAFPIASPLFYWLFGKLDSWADALLLFVGNLVVACLMILFYILGSKIPKKDDESAKE